MAETSQKFKLDMAHLQKVQRTIRKAGNIFPNETELVNTLEDLIIKAQDDTSLNTYYSMAQYLKQRIKELRVHLDAPVQEIEEAYTDLDWSINYLQWLVTDKPKEL
ncbi:MAG TPA: hypothetical protein VFX57_00195 [Sulfuricurvum sp.]|nr:hypothetical protein [Sulfuricurvum sp.]